MTRRLAYVMATGILATLGVLAGGPAALAHATLVSTSPADGAIVPREPAQVSATFDEAVGVSADSLKVFAPNGNRVDTGGTTHGTTPEQIVVRLNSGLARGTYTVGWHVISADSHPVQGAFTFSIGAPSSTSVNPATLGRSAGPLVGIAFGLVRWLAFCCFALLIGSVWFLILCWPAGASRPLVLRLTMAAWGGLAGSVLAAVLLQGAYGSGQGVGHLFWPNVLHATLYSRYGRALGIRLLLAIAALFVFTMTLGTLRADARRSRLAAAAAWGVLTAGLAATWAAADHAGTGIQVPLSVPSDIVHLTAMAIWLGGLTMLATIVLRRTAQPGRRQGKGASRGSEAATAEAALAVARFSPIALGCVVALVVTGTYQAWRGVGGWGALAGTTYGRLVLVKISAMCVLIALGYLARSRVAALRAPAVTPAATLTQWLSPAALLRAGAGARSSLARLGAGVLPGHDDAGLVPGNGAQEAAGNGVPGRAAGNGTARTRVSGNGVPSARASRNGVPPGRAAGNGAPPVRGVAANGGTGGAGRVPLTLARLRRGVVAEAVIALVVLAVTAVLVNTPTARETFLPPATGTVAFSTGGPGGTGRVSVTVLPAGLGPNQIRVTVTGGKGGPYAPAQIDATLSLPAKHLGPLAVPLKRDGAGQYAGGPVTVAFTGQWQLLVTIRSDAFDETTVAIPVIIH